MRDIKVKAFYEQSQTWVYFTINQPLTDVAKAIHQNICINGGVFYEFIGLKDKNLKDIYEGHKVKFKLLKEYELIGEKELTGVIEWDEEDAGFYISSDTDRYPHIKIWFTKDLEIIDEIN